MWHGVHCVWQGTTINCRCWLVMSLVRPGIRVHHFVVGRLTAVSWHHRVSHHQHTLAQHPATSLGNTSVYWCQDIIVRWRIGSQQLLQKSCRTVILAHRSIAWFTVLKSLHRNLGQRVHASLSIRKLPVVWIWWTYTCGRGRKRVTWCLLHQGSRWRLGWHSHWRIRRQEIKVIQKIFHVLRITHLWKAG